MMPLEIKCHSLTDLKDLNSGIESLTRCERGNTFTLHYTTLKRAHLQTTLLRDCTIRICTLEEHSVSLSIS